MTPETAANITARLAEKLLHYRSHPIEFITQVIGATPTKQQVALIKLAVSPNARVAVKSCTSSGKTAALAWLTLFFLSCYPNCKIVTTAPTAGQLHRVFRSELSLWHSRMMPLFADMFEIMADNIHIKGKKATQFCAFVTGSPENKESFAGYHADKMVILVDEASALPSEIFDTLLGTLSSGDTSFILVSNPVRSSGAFFNLWQNENPESRWKLLTFDSFGSPNVDLDWIEEVKITYGEDSDFYKMRVLGEFPILDSAQFIHTSSIEAAMSNTLNSNEYMYFPRVLGCDVARFGDDSSVIADKQGPKVHDITSYKGLDTVEFTNRIIEKFHSNTYDCIFVDGIGIGAGVVDQLKRFQIPVVDVVVSTKSTDPRQYFNLRSQIYGRLRDWLLTADVPYSKELHEDLAGINYSFNSKLQVILESKKDMKKRGISSPDRSDALALTFANEVYAGSFTKVTARRVTQSAFLWA